MSGFLALLALLAQLGLAAERVEIASADGTLLQAALVHPAGPPRGPGIVMLHGCGGPVPRRDAQWARHFAAAGHPVLLPDSFGSRGLGSQCRERASQVTPGGPRRADAIAAAAWLADRPGTPPGGIVLAGWSHGGSTVLWTARARPDLPQGLFRGFVAFYPGCRRVVDLPNYALSGRLLLLIGEDDDWTPAAPCRTYVHRFATQIDSVFYPDAGHGFDTPRQPRRTLTGVVTSAAGLGTATIGTNEPARRDALARVPAFIATLPPATPPPR